MRRTYFIALSALALAVLGAAGLGLASGPAALHMDKSRCMQGQLFTRILLAGPTLSPGHKAIKAAMVESPTLPQVYFIAVKFRTRDGSAHTGVWAARIDNLHQSSSLQPYFAVDAVAKKYSAWPDADDHGEHHILYEQPAVAIANNDPYVEAAKGCLRYGLHDEQAAGGATRECLRVEPTLVSDIASGRRGRATFRAPYEAAAVALPGTQNTYVVAVRFTTLVNIGTVRRPPVVGVWVSDSLERAAQLRTVEDEAYLATTWPKLAMKEAHRTKKSMAAAKSCLRD